MRSRERETEGDVDPFPLIHGKEWNISCENSSSISGGIPANSRLAERKWRGRLPPSVHAARSPSDGRVCTRAFSALAVNVMSSDGPRAACCVRLISFHPPRSPPRLPSSQIPQTMAAAASRHLCCATALLSPSAAAAPIRQRVGYGSGSSSNRRLTTRSRTARVSCAYSTGGKGRLAGISVSLGRQPCLRFSYD